MIHQREVGIGHLGRVALDDVGDVDDVEQAVLVQPGGHHVGEVLGHAVASNSPASLATMARSSPRSHSDIRGVSAATFAANRLISAPTASGCGR